eukprot:scaffold2157_cov376-Prasinococcus_capsulatus_cf.AAC.5
MAYACKPTVQLSASASSFKGNSMSTCPARFAAPSSQSARLVVQAKESRIGKVGAVPYAIPDGATLQ